MTGKPSLDQMIAEQQRTILGNKDWINRALDKSIKRTNEQIAARQDRLRVQEQILVVLEWLKRERRGE